MRARPARRLLALALLGAGGCSLVAVRRPPSPPPPLDAPLACTESRVAPALDTTGAIATPILGFTLWGLCVFTSAMQSWSSTPQRLPCDRLLWGTALTTAAYGGSAVYGFHATAECRHLTVERAARAPSPGARPVP